MNRKIPLHLPQQLPRDWQVPASVPTEVPTEEQLKRRDFMSDDFYNESIHAGINTQALVYAAMHAFSTTEIPKLELNDSTGSFNDIFSLQFPDGFKIAARVPRPSFVKPAHIECTVAMMTFARNISGVPVPEIYAWNSKPENPVGVSYILMEWVEGPGTYKGWHRRPQSDRLNILDQLASYHAKFAQPLPFQGLGSIQFVELPFDSPISFEDVKAYRLGPLSEGPLCALRMAPNSWPRTTIPSLREFWLALWQNNVDAITQAHGSDRTAVVSDEYDSVFTLGDFLDISQDLLALIRHCPLPTEHNLLQPCLAFTDYAFRNIKMDPDTLRITSFLDWDDVYVTPFLLCSRYPEDICAHDGENDPWIEAGAFRFIPIDEEGELVEQADFSVTGDYETVQDGDGIEGAPGDEDGPETDEEEDDEDEDDEQEEDSLLEAQDDITALHPPLDLSDIPMDTEEDDRRLRVMDTWHRQHYRRFLANHDPRFGVEGFWEMRTLPLKIQYLTTHGWNEWLPKCEWVKAAAAELTG